MENKGCVILAAGKNTRLDTGKPKTLLAINGLTLLERHIALFSKNGIDKFCVITGHQSSAIEEELMEIRKRHTVDIETVYNAEYDLENGLSVWQANKWVKKQNLDSFFLTMADHIFEPNFVRDFLTVDKNPNATLWLAVDKPGSHNAHVDIDDVTKVLGENGLIRQIGKKITEFNYYDTGLFEMKKEVFEEFSRSFEQGKYSISDTVQALTSKKLSQLVEIVGYQWNDVDNSDDYQKSLELDID
ncbi:MAG: NTP transferase domain-containing protein [Bacteroidota bacterium]